MKSCKKTSFANEKYALEYCKILKKTSLRSNVPTRPYLCEKCLNWHVSSKDTTHSKYYKLLKKLEGIENDPKFKSLLREKNLKISELEKKVHDSRYEIRYLKNKIKDLHSKILTDKLNNNSKN